MLKLADSPWNRNIVQIFNADQTHIINTILAIPNYRLQPAGDSHFLFWETPPGTARAMRAWFYPGDNYGQEFPYPKQLRQIAYVAPAAPAPVLETAPAPPPEPPAPPPAAEAAPVPQPEAAPPPEPEATPAPEAEPAPPPPQEPAPAPAPAELPTTATPYPMIGAGGLLALGLFTLLRLKRAA